MVAVLVAAACGVVAATILGFAAVWLFIAMLFAAEFGATAGVNVAAVIADAAAAAVFDAGTVFPTAATAFDTAIVFSAAANDVDSALCESIALALINDKVAWFELVFRTSLSVAPLLLFASLCCAFCFVRFWVAQLVLCGV